MGKKNICRPIIFYNNYVPPVGEVQKWDYCAFGTVDGIDVEDSIVGERDNEEDLLKKYGSIDWHLTWI